LKAIGKQGVGIDKIDSEACLKRGIKVLNTPGVNAWAVAELVLALVMALVQEIRSISLHLTAGERVPEEQCSGLIMHKRSLGVIGMCNIGKTVAKMFQGAFDSPIIAYDPYMSADAWADVPHSRVSGLEDLLRQADVVTIHVQITPGTKNLIAYRELEMMKSTCILINTAKGGIVNEGDLIRWADAIGIPSRLQTWPACVPIISGWISMDLPSASAGASCSLSRSWGWHAW
jgi:phosphoglycerate dehydrogenase-like enzyme